MKLSNIKRLLVEDFPSQAEWIDKLLVPLNTFVDQVSQALDRGLTIGDNLDQQVNQITFLGADTISFKVNTRNRPQGLTVSRFETLSGTAPTSAPFPTWTYSSTDSTITVNSWFGGLTTTAKYRVTFLIHTS